MCGGVAAYKAAALTSTLVQRGALVDVVMTAIGRAFCRGAERSRRLRGRPVYTSPWDAPERIPHIRLVREAQADPRRAGHRQSHCEARDGIADDLLTTALLAARIPIVLAPAMNDAMYAETIRDAVKPRQRCARFTSSSIRSAAFSRSDSAA